MDKKQIIKEFWNDVAAQEENRLKQYFAPGAYIRWNDTNEQFTVDEFIRANCEYPGIWYGEVERIEGFERLYISVARVWEDDGASFHAISFFEFDGDQIAVLNEYWGEDGPAPQWRLDKHIGTAIK